MNNEQMIPNRFANWARYRRAARVIRENAMSGRTVVVQNYGVARGFKITAKNADQIEARKSGLYVLSGKSRLCVMDRSISCRITAH